MLGAFAALLFLFVAALSASGPERRASASTECEREHAPESERAQEPDAEEPEPEADADADADAPHEEAEEGEAGEVCGVEGVLDQERAAAYNRARLGGDSPDAFVRATELRARAAATVDTSVPGTGGTWQMYGHGPLLGNDPTYPTTLGDGFGRIEGRINDFAYVPQTGKLYAAVAQGGLWESTDLGDSWFPIGDNLPIQATGSVAWTPSGGGTLIVATGDMAFSNDYGGVGTFWSTDDGATWHKASGAPDGALSFRVVVDPTNPDVVYLATGKGLFRSTDFGHSFVNVDLPTGSCHGNSDAAGCFFANVVTDVAVQPTDTLGHTGGAVVAAVGWRNGTFPNFEGHPQAPANGLYRSTTGAAGTFTVVPDAAGFTPQARLGRVALGTTTGAGQDSNYLYAVAQDSVLFQEQTGGESDLPLGLGTPSVLDAVYVSPDFGVTWKVMETRTEFFNPANLSALSQLTALGIGPGYQTTYNEFIKPDPTRKSINGVPTRVILGMEEVWQNAVPDVPQDGHTSFEVFGSYTAVGGACLAVPEQCGTAQMVAPHTTTHPDQHGVIMIPDGNGGVTLVVGNDGGAYKQHVGALGEFTQLGWGNGANTGFETLLPYGAAMAKDGTLYAGLQDNGQLKILPNGEQHTVYVGDGTFALVDPDNSNIAYDELPNAGINVSTDGGTTWSSIAPALKSPGFVAPMVMDPHDAKQILVAGRNIVETLDGPNTSDWTYVFDLGTHDHPGDVSALETDDDSANSASAAAMDGNNIYVGFCGSCDPVKLGRRFAVGLATNVGGAEAPHKLSDDGWHFAAANGLPSRIITAVAMDPDDPNTVYVTLGSGANRYFAPLGSLEEDTSDIGTGHVFKSTDAGENFVDISGDLPDVQATWVLPRGQQLIIGTAIGTYISGDNSGDHYALLGGMPPVAIYQLSYKPGDPNTIVAATYGRGIWTYTGTWANATGPGGETTPTGPLTRTGGNSATAWVGAVFVLCALVASFGLRRSRERVSPP